MRRGAWLVLLYQVPQGSSSARVRVWRRLQAMGAVQVRQAAYLLPNRDEPREDLEWLKAEITGQGGEAMLLVADATDAFAHDEIVATFRAARARDVAALATRATRLLERLRKAETAAARVRTRLAPSARALVDEFHALAAITFFDTPGFVDLEALMPQITASAGRPGQRPAPAGERLDPRAFARRVWVTRPRPGIDRMASAWLIRRFIDSRARFEFAERPVTGAVPFDMYDVELGHQGEACTFEVLAARFAVDDPVVPWLGRIVHQLDLRDGRFTEPEAPGVGLLVEGLRHAHPDDRELLERGIALFESLARGFPGRGALSAGSSPAGPEASPRGRSSQSRRGGRQRRK